MNKIKLDTKTTPGHLLIAEERMEMLTKHGISLDSDRQWLNGELMAAMRFCLTLKDEAWPEAMSTEVRDNIRTKTRVERMAYAGAFLAAEMDRFRLLQSVPFMTLR